MDIASISYGFQDKNCYYSLTKEVISETESNVEMI